MYTIDQSFDLGEPIDVAFSLGEMSLFDSSQFDAKKLFDGEENDFVDV